MGKCRESKDLLWTQDWYGYHFRSWLCFGKGIRRRYCRIHNGSITNHSHQLYPVALRWRDMKLRYTSKPPLFLSHTSHSIWVRFHRNQLLHQTPHPSVLRVRNMNLWADDHLDMLRMGVQYFWCMMRLVYGRKGGLLGNLRKGGMT